MQRPLHKIPLAVNKTSWHYSITCYFPLKTLNNTGQIMQWRKPIWSPSKWIYLEQPTYSLKESVNKILIRHTIFGRAFVISSAYLKIYSIQRLNNKIHFLIKVRHILLSVQNAMTIQNDNMLHLILVLHCGFL